jgi:hypothetical protein
MGVEAHKSGGWDHLRLRDWTMQKVHAGGVGLPEVWGSGGDRFAPTIGGFWIWDWEGSEKAKRLDLGHEFPFKNFVVGPTGAGMGRARGVTQARAACGADTPIAAGECSPARMLHDRALVRMRRLSRLAPSRASQRIPVLTRTLAKHPCHMDHGHVPSFNLRFPRVHELFPSPRLLGVRESIRRHAFKS